MRPIREFVYSSYFSWSFLFLTMMKGNGKKAKRKGAKIENFCIGRRSFSTCLRILQSKLLNEMTGMRICPSYTHFFQNPTDPLSLHACLLLFLELIKQLT